MAKSSASTLTQLGRPTELPASPDEARLETVPNPHRDARYVVRFICPEFTSLCPVTGQPDFAHLVIDCVPKDRLVESKSLNCSSARFATTARFTRTAR
jgi:7-cyano-7-deazaguanine reductase